MDGGGIGAGGSLVIANVNSGLVTAQYAAALAETFRRFPAALYLTASSPYVTENRNRLLHEFLETDRPWMLMIDSDIHWTPDQIAALRLTADERARPVVSGLYFQPFGSGVTASPCAWALDRQQVDWSDGGLVEAVAFGAGFMLCHASVLRHLALAQDGVVFEQRYVEGRFLGEDLIFCRSVRALGHRLWVHTGVIVSHVKPTMLRPNLGGLIEETASLDEVAV